MQSYDGCGMTAGLDQHIAVYPRELSKPDDGNALDDQGTLWKLLRRIEMIPMAGNLTLQSSVDRLWSELAAWNWYIAADGVLRDMDTGNPVPGRAIREVLTPRQGCPSTKADKGYAEKWIRIFHAIFSHVDTFRAQIEYGKEHLVKRTKRRKLRVYNRTSTVEHGAYLDREITSLIVGKDFSMELDLALCMYQAHSVNAPAIANKAIRDASKYPERFARLLIQNLGNSKYGRWDDDIKNGRYQRTRSAARASGLWPKKLFDGPRALTLMPEDLQG